VEVFLSEIINLGSEVEMNRSRFELMQVAGFVYSFRFSSIGRQYYAAKTLKGAAYTRADEL